MGVSRPVSLLFILVITLLIVGCGREDPTPTIELAETPVLSGRGSYALVTIEYARLYDRPDTAGETLTHARRGDVLAVLSTTPDQGWYELRERDARGWVVADALRFFSTEEQARNARGMLDLR